MLFQCFTILTLEFLYSSFRVELLYFQSLELNIISHCLCSKAMLSCIVSLPLNKTFSNIEYCLVISEKVTLKHSVWRGTLIKDSVYRGTIIMHSMYRGTNFMHPIYRDNYSIIHSTCSETNIMHSVYRGTISCSPCTVEQSSCSPCIGELFHAVRV